MQPIDETTLIPGTAVELQASLREQIRPAAASLPESGIIEVVNYGRERADLTPFWVGQGDLPTPKFICDAATKGLYDGQTFYTYQRGIPELRAAVVSYHQRHFNVDPGSERIIITGSGMQGMMEACQATVGAGDEVVVVSPVWPNIYACVHLQQAVSRSVPLTLTATGWSLDMDALFAACNEKTRAIYLNTPGNPTGWVMPGTDMLALRDFARQRGLWILADEVYGKFVYEQHQPISFLEICEADELLIVCNSFSKNWAMTGWRVGWLVIPEKLGQVFENLVQYNTSGVPEFLQRGCIAACNDGDEFLQGQIDTARAGRDYTVEALGTLPNVQTAIPDGAFYLFFSVNGEPDSVALAKRLVDKANIGVAPGSAFGLGGEGYVRLCFAASLTTLETGITRLQEYLHSTA